MRYVPVLLAFGFMILTVAALAYMTLTGWTREGVTMTLAGMAGSLMAAQAYREAR